MLALENYISFSLSKYSLRDPRYNSAGIFVPPVVTESEMPPVRLQLIH